MKKNLIFTFVFACIPGAGQMYLGYIKRGLSLMSLLCAVCAVMMMFQLEPLAMILPVIFAYSFFDTFRIRNLTQQQLAETTDDYAGYVKWLMGQDFKLLAQTRHKLLGWGLIGVGAFLMYRLTFGGVLYDLFYSLQLYWVNSLLRQLPSLALAVALVLLGVYLLRGHKETTTDEYVAFKGDTHHDA